MQTQPWFKFTVILHSNDNAKDTNIIIIVHYRFVVVIIIIIIVTTG